jgi:hypothetical protein
VKNKRLKYKIGIILIVVEVIAYISSLSGYGIGYINSFSDGDILGGMADFVGFNLIGAIGIVLVLTSGRKNEKAD